MAAMSAPNVTSRRPEDYDYSRPSLNCDMVMKGGITSGIVYPLTICEIAKTYRFRNVGGTSAGAIAAATAAAAEFGRAVGGFRRLAGLPGWLGSDANLFNLFQPQANTRRLYTVLTAGIKAGGNPLRNIVMAAARGFPGWTALGAAPGVLLAILLIYGARGLMLGWGILCAFLLALVGAASALGVALCREALSAIPRNFYGLCAGSAATPFAPAMTPWLTDELDLLAGKATGAGPLTFGDLLQGPTGTQPAGEPAINLQMVTTNLTQGRGYRIPFEPRVWFFDPNEFGQLFPDRVVQWMVAQPPEPPTLDADRRRWELLSRLLLPLRPLPDAANLPVVVGARMSLSFPLLISAVPLWSIDWSKVANDQADAVWRGWLARESDWEAIRDHPDRWQNGPAQRPQADRCWFSDGGLTSNFPVHFFDSPIPRWPTFDINLRPFHPDHPESKVDECDNVWLPKTNAGGIGEWWVAITSLGGFVRSIFDTLQNGQTNAQLHVPGYRDRIAHVQLADDEGGMNLNMPKERIRKLSERGRCAGEKLALRFSTGDGTPLTWDNHRWVRYRTTMQLWQDALDKFQRAYQQLPGTGLPYPALIDRGPDVPPTSYPWRNPMDRITAIQATADIVGLTWPSSAPSFGGGAPKPTPELRTRPRI